ncbi:hypothetical protein Peur_030429 [Populus x canadensis]
MLQLSGVYWLGKCTVTNENKVSSHQFYISSVFLKYLIENAQNNNSIEELYLSLNVSEPAPNDFNTGISLHIQIKTSIILSCMVYFCSMLC